MRIGFKLTFRSNKQKYIKIQIIGRSGILIKVLYLINHAGKAGTERYVETLVQKLNNKKIKAYFAYNEEGLLVDRLKELGVSTYKIKMRNPFDIKAVFEVVSFCKKQGIELIHTQFLRENYIALISKLINPSIKVMYTNHFVMKNNKIQRFFNKLLTKLESNVVAVCNIGKELLISNGFKRDIINVIFNGVDIEYWREPIKSTLREEFSIPTEEVVFLCSSRFAHDKGHKFLIESVSRLKEQTDLKFKCVLSNDGPLLDECKKMVEKLGIKKEVIFTGFRKDIKNLIYGSDIYINASEHEALSFAIIEVLACGIPVIATDMAGNSDIINDETKCGVLVKYDDVGDLTNAMKVMMENKKERETYKKNALITVEDRFNLDKVANKTYELYEKSCRDLEVN